MDSTALLTLQSAQTSAQIGRQQNALQRSDAALAGTGQGKSGKLGLDFEAMCLSNMLSPMFEGLSTDGPFGGGQGEDAMRSFLIDAISQQVAKRGGLGISDMMQQQLLRMQEA